MSIKKSEHIYRGGEAGTDGTGTSKTGQASIDDPKKKPPTPNDGGETHK